MEEDGREKDLSKCLIEGELNLDQLKSDLAIEHRAIESINSQIAQIDQKIANLDELKRVEEKESLNYRREHEKLQSINDQLRRNHESVKKLRDDHRKKLGYLKNQWKNEKESREKILNEQMSKTQTIVDPDKLSTKNHLAHFKELKAKLLVLMQKNMPKQSEIIQELEKRFNGYRPIEFSSASSFQKYLLDIKDSICSKTPKIDQTYCKDFQKPLVSSQKSSSQDLPVMAGNGTNSSNKNNDPALEKQNKVANQGLIDGLRLIKIQEEEAQKDQIPEFKKPSSKPNSQFAKESSFASSKTTNPQNHSQDCIENSANECSTESQPAWQDSFAISFASIPTENSNSDPKNNSLETPASSFSCFAMSESAATSDDSNLQQNSNFENSFENFNFSFDDINTSMGNDDQNDAGLFMCHTDFGQESIAGNDDNAMLF